MAFRRSVTIGRKTLLSAIKINERFFFDNVSRDWEKAWQQNVTPWDLKGTVLPPLVEAVESGKIETKGKRALVPGCGAGYECAYLKQKGFDSVLGLDLSETAVQKATEHLASYSPDLVPNVRFEVANFFFFRAKEKFDFLFDYLFFSAIDPPDRIKWAQSVAANLTSKGQLVTLVFPLRNQGDDGNVGPPYPVTVEDYERVLHPMGFVVKSIDKEINSVKPRKGREWMVYWERRKLYAGQSFSCCR